MQRTFKFVVNPVAGPGNNLSYWRSLKKVLLQNGIEFKSKITKREGHATRWAAKRVKKDTDSVIVSVGGDGTFNEVASVLVNSPLQIAHIPRGSGNGLARMLHIPSKIKKIPAYLKEGQPVSIDAGSFNGHFFFCTAGFGFDALIAHQFRTSKRRGFKSYIFYILRAFFSYRGVEAKFTLDGEPVSGKFFIVTIANANQYGNNAFIAPKADLQDGLFDVTIIRPFSKWMMPVVVLALFGKRIHKLPFVEYRRAKEMEVQSVSAPYFHRDGEAAEYDLPVSARILPGALQILVNKK